MLVQSKPKTRLIVLLTILGVATASYFVSAKFLNLWPFPEVSISTPIFTPKPTQNDQLADWQIYRNEKYGFEVRYPDYYRGLEDVEDLREPTWKCTALLCLVAFPKWEGDWLDFGINVFKTDNYRFETGTDEIKYDRGGGVWLKKQKTNESNKWEEYFPEYKIGEGWVGFKFRDDFTHPTIYNEGTTETWTYDIIAIPYRENHLIELTFVHGPLTGQVEMLAPIVSSLRLFGPADMSNWLTVRRELTPTAPGIFYEVKLPDDWEDLEIPGDEGNVDHFGKNSDILTIVYAPYIDDGPIKVISRGQLVINGTLFVKTVLTDYDGRLKVRFKTELKKASDNTSLFFVVQLEKLEYQGVFDQILSTFKFIGN
jgi:hypothetical protein